MNAMIIVVMGVAGAGKSTVGRLLAAELHCEFLDGDLLPSSANIEKMTRGIPLTDADRAPWLAAIHARLADSFQRGRWLVVACSALKQRYRDTLGRGVAITWVYLKGSEEVIRACLLERQHHFFKAQMLASQFADLEDPANAMVIDVAAEPSVAIGRTVAVLSPARAKQASSEGNHADRGKGTTMKAERILQFGSPNVILNTDIARPQPGETQVLVRVKAAGVGPWDALIREGRILPQPLPLTLGSDLAGVVDAMASTSAAPPFHQAQQQIMKEH